MVKRYILANLIITLFCCQLSASAQWTLLTHGYPSSLRIADVAAKGSTIIGVGYTLSDFQGYILSSFNSGAAFDSVLPFSPGKLFETVAFKDNDTAFVGGMGSNSFLLNTVDGGHHWNSYLNDPATGGIADIVFLDSRRGFAGGYGTSQFYSGSCYYTNDGGRNWVERTVDAGTCIDTIGMDHVDFVDAQTGYAVNNFLPGRYLLKTTDSGKHWNLAYELEGMGGVYFWNVNNGVMVAEGGQIFKTTDGGMHWTPKPSPTTAPLFSVSFADNNNGYAVGAYGRILKTTDGGETWTSVTSPTTQTLFKVKCFDGKYYASGDGGVILSSSPAPATAVTELPLSYQLNVYPNPGSSMLNISSTVNYTFKSIFVNLVDIKGQIVKNGQTDKGLIRLDIKDLASGVYTALVDADGRQLAEQVVIQH